MRKATYFRTTFFSAIWLQKTAKNEHFSTFNQKNEAFLGENCQSREYGNPASITDVGVGAQCGFTGVKGGIFNVLINLKEIKDADFINEMKSKCKQLEEEASKELNEVMGVVESKI